MTTAHVTWTWDSLVTTVNVDGGPDLVGYRILTTSLNQAFLWGPNMTADYHRLLNDAVVAPEGDGWKVTGTNAAGLPETWTAKPVARNGGCGPCGRR